MRKLKSLENFNQGLTAEKTRMFQGGGPLNDDPDSDTFVVRGGDQTVQKFTAFAIETFVEIDGDTEWQAVEAQD